MGYRLLSEGASTRNIDSHLTGMEDAPQEWGKKTGQELTIMLSVLWLCARIQTKTSRNVRPML